MKMMIKETGLLLGHYIDRAESFIQRFKGLMLKKHLPIGHGLYIRPCKAVHTFFMKFEIDVLHLDEEGRIVGMEQSLKPGTFGKAIPATKSVVELPAGTLEQEGIYVGQTVVMM
jgi:uncharacterized membrane protein (UPF0127 family)